MNHRGNISDRLTSDSPENDRQFVTALARGLEILRCFKPGNQFLGNRELVSRTGLPKATVSRLTYTLTELGYLSYSENLGKYSLGTGVLALGYCLLGKLGIRQVARPMMQELAEYAQVCVALGARDRLNMVYLENCYSSTATLGLRLDVGSRIPIATTAMGRAMLAALPERERDHLMDHIRNDSPVDWPRIKAGIEQALQDYRERGFCLTLGDWQQDVHAVAVPLIMLDGLGILVFNCGGPAFQISRHKLEDDLGPRLVNLVHGVEVATGRR